MADLGGTFDANARENQKPFNGLPAGEYPVVMVKSERKPTSKGDGGAYLECEFKVVAGEMQNRSIFHKFNIWLMPSATDPEQREKTEKAIAIAKGQFSEFCKAVGVLTPKNSDELHNKPCMMRLTIKDNGQYGLQNQVQSFKPKQLSAPVAPPAVAQTSGAAW